MWNGFPKKKGCKADKGIEEEEGESERKENKRSFMQTEYLKFFFF